MGTAIRVRDRWCLKTKQTRGTHSARCTVVSRTRILHGSRGLDWDSVTFTDKLALKAWRNQSIVFTVSAENVQMSAPSNPIVDHVVSILPVILPDIALAR